MQIPSSIVSLTSRAVSESMDVNVMTHVAKDIIDGYDLFQRTGFRESMVVPQKDAANQIVRDMARSGKFFYFISLLIQMHTAGYKGRIYPIKYLKDIVKMINEECGFIYDMENNLFVEDPAVRRTRNWGAFLEGRDYNLSFLRLDIVGNSQLVRKYPDNLIQATYADLRKIVEKAIDKRNGRIWNWEGDGGLIAFYFANKSHLATMSGMEIINELFVYNALHCRLEEPLKVRVAVHAGMCQYTESVADLLKNDVIKETVQIESKYTRPNSMTISNTVGSKLDASILEGFETLMIDNRLKFYAYSVSMEQ
ncbi:MAG TPA: hypothetical protein PLM53_18935 [Spirochaetota bacterium]|nr:hypothetical protein [Spirochaetota bacterium]HPC42817.1 hypothetical protein [Spirochaetota bacterium]HPL18004.1 hypothetical protein [Spirochaetota bacterium]HQF10294.1 hypothetical protein [Spirochaetota bacterium]HQH99172.1 hypothetical protein [Spirochaetota bacterium]